MRFTSTPRTWQEVINHPAVDCVDVRSLDEGYIDEIDEDIADATHQIFLKHGYAICDTRAARAHGRRLDQGFGTGVADAIANTFPVVVR